MSTTPRSASAPRDSSRLSQVLRAGLAIEAPKCAREPDEYDPKPDPWPERKPNYEHPSWYYPMRGDQEPNRESMWSQSTSNAKPGRGGGGGGAAYPDPWPLSQVNLARERARPVDERQGWSSMLFSWWMRELAAKAENGPNPNPGTDEARAMWRERYRLASRMARSDYQTAFPDDPPSDLSDSDDDMRQDQVEQHAALRRAQRRA